MEDSEEAGEPQLVLPGTNFNAATSSPIAQALARRSRVVLVDLPGQPGLSSEYRPPRRGRLGWYGRWLSSLLAEIADEPVTVVGWSMGAAVALASHSPQLGRQVLVCPGGVMRLRTPPAVLAAGAGWAVRRRRSDAVRLLRVMHGPRFTPRPALVEWMTLVARHVRSTRDPGLAPKPLTASAERVAIGGEQDVFLPPAQLGHVLRALDIELVTVPGGGHLLAEEHPGEVASLVFAR